MTRKQAVNKNLRGTRVTVPNASRNSDFAGGFTSDQEKCRSEPPRQLCWGLGTRGNWPTDCFPQSYMWWLAIPSSETFQVIVDLVTNDDECEAENPQDLSWLSRLSNGYHLSTIHTHRLRRGKLFCTSRILWRDSASRSKSQFFAFVLASLTIDMVKQPFPSISNLQDRRAEQRLRENGIFKRGKSLLLRVEMEMFREKP